MWVGGEWLKVTIQEMNSESCFEMSCVRGRAWDEFGEKDKVDELGSGELRWCVARRDSGRSHKNKTPIQWCKESFYNGKPAASGHLIWPFNYIQAFRFARTGKAQRWHSGFGGSFAPNALRFALWTCTNWKTSWTTELRLWRKSRARTPVEAFNLP